MDNHEIDVTQNGQIVVSRTGASTSGEEEIIDGFFKATAEGLSLLSEVPVGTTHPFFEIGDDGKVRLKKEIESGVTETPLFRLTPDGKVVPKTEPGVSETGQKYKTIVTPAGQAIIALAIAGGGKVNITHVSLGDGGGAAYVPAAGQTALKHELFQAEANTVYVHSGNPNWVVVELYVPEAAGGWWIREIAIKDDAGNVIAVGSVPAVYKPVMAQGTGMGGLYRFVMEVANASVINLRIDPSTVMATVEYVINAITGHANQTKAHGGSYEKTPERLMWRNIDGRCQVAAPLVDDDAVPMRWALEQIEALRRRMEILGEIRLLPHQYDELPLGWYFCNGERYTPDSPQAQALAALPESFRRNWKITTTVAGTNVPLLLDASGRGYFLRGVDGVTRAPGSVEQDAARPVSASASTSTSTNTYFSNAGSGTMQTIDSFGMNTQEPTGIISRSGKYSWGWANDEGGGDIFDYQIYKIDMGSAGLSSSSSSFTSVSISQANQGPENRPTNIGMTPAIYLGV